MLRILSNNILQSVSHNKLEDVIVASTINVKDVLSLLNFVHHLSKLNFLSTAEKRYYTETSLNGSSELELASRLFFSDPQTAYAEIVSALKLEDAQELRESFEASWLFAQTTESLLSYGGDDRLTIQADNGYLNKYYCTTIPSDNEIIRRGSCTCSTISPAVFRIAEDFRLQLVSNSIKYKKQTLSLLNESICSRLMSLYGLSNSSADILLCPSGSDAEYIPLCVAIIRHKEILLKSNQSPNEPLRGNQIFTVITGAGEVGSGTAAAASGNHFSPISPSGKAIVNGSPLKGITSGIEMLSFQPRDNEGTVSFRQNEIFSSIRSKLEANPYGIAVLHVVCSSKTGLVYPTLPAVRSFAAEMGNRLVVVLDLCQLRCVRLQRISELVAEGFICLTTGSKFFAGPPFWFVLFILSLSVIILS